MSEQIREQVSAFLDGELPNSESELLLKRMTRDAQLRDSFGRYALIGECLRGATTTRLTQGFASRVNRAIDGSPALVDPAPARARSRHWWRPFAGVAVAAGVAAVAVVALQQRAVAPPVRAALPLSAPALVAKNGATGAAKEALSYTVPPAALESPTALPAARLTNYVFAHSKYSSVLGQNDVLNDLLSGGDAVDAAANDAAARHAAGLPLRDAQVGP